MNKGYRFVGFVGGGDEHKGRPGDSLGYLGKTDSHPQGFHHGSGGVEPGERLRRDQGGTNLRDDRPADLPGRHRAAFGPDACLTLRPASEDGLAQAEFVQNGSTRTVLALQAMTAESWKSPRQSIHSNRATIATSAFRRRRATWPGPVPCGSSSEGNPARSDSSPARCRPDC